MVSPQAHNGDTYSAYPWHQLCICLWYIIESGSFNQPIDKASCDAFPSCSVQPYNSTHLNGHHRQRAVDRGKDTKKLAHCTRFCEKNSSFVDNLRKKEQKSIFLIGDEVTDTWHVQHSVVAFQLKMQVGSLKVQSCWVTRLLAHRETACCC